MSFDPYKKFHEYVELARPYKWNHYSLYGWWLNVEVKWNNYFYSVGIFKEILYVRVGSYEFILASDRFVKVGPKGEKTIFLSNEESYQDVKDTLASEYAKALLKPSPGFHSKNSSLNYVYPLLSSRDYQDYDTKKDK